MYSRLVLCICLFWIGCKQQENPKWIAINPTPVSVENVQTIAFGSCNNQNSDQEMWKEIQADEPDLWIWLGDNIYADTEDMDEMREMYIQQKAHPEYKAFIYHTAYIGTWDDHDFGANDAGAEYPKKAESQQLFLDFMDVPKDDPRRTREGIYVAHTYGTDSTNSLKIIMLDGRYFRDAFVNSKETGKRYEPTAKGTFLGEAQWTWLEEKLSTNPTRLTIIGFGIQIIPTEQGFEKMYNFPAERERLLDLIASSGNEHVILLTGDRHIGEISQFQHPDMKHPITEVTASGLTHSYESVGDEPNSFRKGIIVSQRNYGLMEIDWGDTLSIDVSHKGLNDAIWQRTTLSFK
ncbi:MAG: alkaline phosphatase D family protein [Bacteroidota bacterium]